MMRGDCPLGGVAILETWDAAEMYLRYSRRRLMQRHAL